MRRAREPAAMIEKAMKRLSKGLIPGDRNVVMEPYIPPPGINYNQSPARTTAEYVRQFKADACLKELPFLIRRARLTPQSTILDYGCGLGRLAYAASKFLDASGHYFGYEPNQEALSFLRKAYASHTNFSFAGLELPVEEDYVAVQQQSASREGKAAADVSLAGLCTRPIDVQYSSSVFTHMWQSDIVTTLAKITSQMSPAGVSINTWLCVDDHAAYSLRCGLTDRALPYRVGDALTYSQSNPLVCTAYELPVVQAIYTAAGQDILEILPGSWSGGRDNGIHYQDIIVSKPRGGTAS